MTDDVEEKQDNDNDDNEEDGDDKAAGTASCCTSADHPQHTLLYTHLSVVAATYHINSSPSPLSSGLQILKQLAVDV